jgi:hypothetical protein
MRITLLISVMLLLGSCSTKSHNWPNGMTPFFAECEGTQNVYTDNAWGKENKVPVRRASGYFTIEANRL